MAQNLSAVSAVLPKMKNNIDVGRQFELTTELASDLAEAIHCNSFIPLCIV